MSTDFKEKSKKKIKINRKQILTIVIVVGIMVVVLLVGVLVRWIQIQIDNNSSNSNSAAIEGLPSDPPPTELNKAQEMADQGDYEGSNESIKEELDKSNDESVKYNLYLQQGINYENQEKYDEAIQSYREAESISQTYAIYEALGRVYEMKGNKQAAIDSYKKAIPLIDSESPMAEADKEYFEERIVELGGSL